MNELHHLCSTRSVLDQSIPLTLTSFTRWWHCLILLLVTASPGFPLPVATAVVLGGVVVGVVRRLHHDGSDHKRDMHRDRRGHRHLPARARHFSEHPCCGGCESAPRKKPLAAPSRGTGAFARTLGIFRIAETRKKNILRAYGEVHREKR